MWQPESQEGRLLLVLARGAISRALAVPGPDPDRLLSEALEREALAWLTRVRPPQRDPD